MPEKNIVDVIQSLLEKNKGFMTVKRLADSVGIDGKRELGIRKGESGKVIRRKIELSAGDRFMFKMKGNIVYILEPCEPSEFVLGLLSENKAFDTRIIRTLPFTKAELVAVVNELVEDGRAKVMLTEKFTPKIYSVKPGTRTANVPAADEGDYTQDKFREAFEKSDKGRSFVRIFKMRRYLNWPREVFDDMVMRLLRGGKIFVHQADPTVLKKDEYEDSFMDEFGHMKGTMTWNE